MYTLVFHVRPDGSCPYNEYVQQVHGSGRKGDAAKIRAFVERLRQFGSQRLAAMQAAEKMNDVWQLRPGRHRIFYFWYANVGRYVLLNGFQKKSRKTPPAELNRAETLRAEHLSAHQEGE